MEKESGNLCRFYPPIHGLALFFPSPFFLPSIFRMELEAHAWKNFVALLVMMHCGASPFPLSLGGDVLGLKAQVRFSLLWLARVLRGYATRTSFFLPFAHS